MRIGLSSIVGDGFGNGSFVFGEVPSGGGFPAYGTVIQTFSNYEYPIAQGGSYFDSPVDGTTDIPNQKCTVDEVADGAGGVFLDWSNERDVAFKDYNTIWYVDTSALVDYTLGGTTTAYGIGVYYNQRANVDYRHDGSGYCISGFSNASYYPYGTFMETYTDNREVPSGNGVFIASGLVYDYKHNGTGGNYFSTVSDFYTYGTFARNDGYFDYYWDGNGGYYT